MKISLTSISVKDQDQALKFYTEILGFEKKEDSPMGEYRWLTVVSPDGVTTKGSASLIVNLICYTLQPWQDYQEL